MFKSGVQAKGLVERRRRQVALDEVCRAELVRFMKAYDRVSLTKAAAWLNKAGVTAPRGGKWTTKAVHRVALRLGLKITCGLAFGEWPLCPKCGRQMGRWFSDRTCHTCRERRIKRRLHGSNERANLADAEAKLQYYQDKVQTLSEGRRFYPPGHSRPTHRFGRPIRQSKKPK